MTDELNQILVGVDGSDGGARALRWAAARAQETGATILATYILTYPQEVMRDLPPTGFGQWRDALEAHLNDQWTAPARESGVTIRCIFIEDSNTVAGLLSVADTQNVDLIVLGAHGHGGITDRLLGSTTYKLTHRARQPVVVVPAGWSPVSGATT